MYNTITHNEPIYNVLLVVRVSFTLSLLITMITQHYMRIIAHYKYVHYAL